MLTILQRKYLSSGVNMLTNSLKIIDTSKTLFLKIIFFQSDQKIWQKYSLADLSSVSDHLTCWLSIRFLVTGLFEHLSNSAFCSLYFQKQITSKAYLLLPSIPNSMYISNIQQKNQKIVFDFKIIAFQLVALKTRFYWERILVIGCQYVNKMPQDFRY